MRFVVLGALVVAVLVAASTSHHVGPPSTSYPDCAGTVTYPITNPAAFCSFHGETVTVGQYADKTVPNAR